MENKTLEIEKSAAEKLKERKERLRNLHKLRQTARSENHQEVIAEDARNKLPKNWESRKRQADWIVSDANAREAAEAEGKDYDRMRMLEVSAIDATKIEKKKQKKNPDGGFSTFEAQTARQYSRLVKNMAPRDMEKYEKQKQELGEGAFYCKPNTLIHNRPQDTPDAINNMVKDLETQIERRKKYSRRRIYNDDADVDFINERNSKFNKKLDRFYGEYTSEIKQNLERGTAI
ncbi:pre-mRNA-splicing factor Syf2 [Episyrphus balteatus]|uniref:pre-mRNA-splicing factor Syf2 n=1 Tax=Episyrphus balteatus TaxID=286459 RepID=UPI0024862042|nr:pre-mRNA-splicing factor Syf2 [Episyrphus balteatus]